MFEHVSINLNAVLQIPKYKAHIFFQNFASQLRTAPYYLRIIQVEAANLIISHRKVVLRCASNMKMDSNIYYSEICRFSLVAAGLVNTLAFINMLRCHNVRSTLS